MRVGVAMLSDIIARRDVTLSLYTRQLGRSDCQLQL